MSAPKRHMNTLRNSLLGLAAAALVAALVYLYDKTQAVDLRESNEVLALLRELKEIDARWDVDILRARLERGGPPALNRTPSARKALQALADAVRRTESPALRAGLPELARAIEEKSALVETYKAATQGIATAFDSVLAAAGELHTSVSAQKLPPGPEVALSRVLAAVTQYYALGQETQRQDAATALAELQTAAASLPAEAQAK